MANERFRLQFKFWLDVNKPEEYELTETIADKREQNVQWGSPRRNSIDGRPLARQSRRATERYFHG